MPLEPRRPAPQTGTESACGAQHCEGSPPPGRPKSHSVWRTSSASQSALGIPGKIEAQRWHHTGSREETRQGTSKRLARTASHPPCSTSQCAIQRLKEGCDTLAVDTGPNMGMSKPTHTTLSRRPQRGQRTVERVICRYCSTATELRRCCPEHITREDVTNQSCSLHCKSG